MTEAVTAGGDDHAAMAKRWEFLAKFESNFNHWCVLLSRGPPVANFWGCRFKVHLDCVQYYASSENVALLPLVVRLNSVKTVS